MEHFTEPDSLLWFGSIAIGVREFQSSIHPGHRGVLLYGQFCAFFATIPSAYYCAARFPDSFEDAVLCSVNGGGQNTMRSSLVGALLGARVGLSNIPARFLHGLEDADYLIELAGQIADVALERGTPDDVWFWPSDSQMNFTIGGPAHHSPTFSQETSKSAMIKTEIVPFSMPQTVAGPNSLIYGAFFVAGAVGLFSFFANRLKRIQQTPRERYTTLS
jgi:hypothetical protein